MLPETVPVRSRRAILFGAIGGAAAFAAGGLGRAAPVSAADGNPIVIGSPNTASSTTFLTNSTTVNAVFQAVHTGAATALGGVSSSGTGMSGSSTTGIGVHGLSDSTIGVRGFCPTGRGVAGTSSEGIGVYGESGSTTKAAIVAISYENSTGLVASSGDGSIPAAKPKTAVYAEALQDSTSRGVWGFSPAGLGVYGESSSGRAVQGVATTGIGVRASASSGTGCYATSTTGYALRTDGRVRLDKSAGQATIASGSASIAVTPGIDLTSGSAVIATLNGDAGGSTAIKRVAINTTTNVFTIYLTANATASVKVAWLVLG